MADSEAQGLRAILAVAAIAVCAAGLVSVSHEISAGRIERNVAERQMRSLHEVLDPSLYDNDLVRTQVWATDPDLLGTTDPVQVFLATRDGQPAAAIFAAVAPRGYNGAINLLVGVDAAGTIQGVRVTDHRETPGLGDRIEISISDWVIAFDGTSLSDPPLPEWAVAPDGGRFDAFTGATVTPRAVVQAVRDALVYFEENKTELFERAAATGEMGAASEPGTASERGSASDPGDNSDPNNGSETVATSETVAASDPGGVSETENNSDSGDGSDPGDSLETAGGEFP